MKPRYFQIVKMNNKPLEKIAIADTFTVEGVKNLFEELEHFNMEAVEITKSQHCKLQACLRENEDTVIIQ